MHWKAVRCRFTRERSQVRNPAAPIFIPRPCMRAVFGSFGVAVVLRRPRRRSAPSARTSRRA